MTDPIFIWCMQESEITQLNISWVVCRDPSGITLVGMYAQADDQLNIHLIALGD